MSRKGALVIMLAVALMGLLACQKPVTQAPRAPAPAPPKNQATPKIDYFEAEPTGIAKGQSSSLRWSVENATSVEIDQGVGPVKSSDRLPVSPAQTTTFLLRATNPVGVTDGFVTVTVSRPPQSPSSSEQDRADINFVNARLKDVHFNYNENNIRPEEELLLETDATILSDLFRFNSSTSVMVKGTVMNEALMNTIWRLVISAQELSRILW